MLSHLGVAGSMGGAVGATVMGGVVTFEKMDPPLVVRQVVVVIGLWLVEIL